MSLPEETPLFIPDPSDGPSLGGARARARRSRQGEMTVLWVILGVVGLCGVGYAVHLALDSTAAPPATPPPAVVHAPPATTTTTTSDDGFGEDFIRVEALRHRLNERKNRAEVPVRETAETKQEPVVEHVREPEPPPPPPENAASFENGSAFDRPAVDSSRELRRAGRSREFGTFQAPAPTRGGAEPADRPNRH